MTSDRPRIPMTPEERNILDALRRIHPNGLVCPLDSPQDLQTKEDGARLLESGIIERRVQPDTDEEEVVPAVMYRLDPRFVTDDLGGTLDPQAN